MELLGFVFVVATLLSSCDAGAGGVVNHIQMLRPRFGGGGRSVEGLNCLSWRLAVETNNLQNWMMVPQSCEEYVGNYMLGEQYRRDVEVVADAAIDYAKSLKAGADGKDLWVFDIDETTLSNLPYFARSDVQFGAMPFNETGFYEWVAEGVAPAIPAILRLYKKVVSLGFKTAILTGTDAKFRDIKIVNLNNAGYYNWETLILKGEGDHVSAVDYKSEKRGELVKKGYRIVGNVGDQWSDLIGTNTGNRTFKVPDPMYYIG